MVECRPPGVTAFGAAAEAWARNLPRGLQAIVTDRHGAARAYARALEHRAAGRSFFVATLLPDSRTELALAVSAAAAQQSYDARRVLFDQLAEGRLIVNDKPVAQLSIYDENGIRAFRDLHMLADALLVRSSIEYERQVALLGCRRRLVAPFAPMAELNLNPSTKSGALVVWAPHLPWEQTMLYLTAVEELRAPATIVAATLPPRETAAQYVLPDEGRHALGLARCVIDAELYDPGVAIALCELGVPLAVASTTGAQAYLLGAHVYDPWNWSGIQQAVYDVAGAAPVSLRSEWHAQSGSSLKGILDAAAAPIVREQPLVSYVIPTYNRPDALENALTCLSRQTYENIECIVVNDGGEPVGDVVARFPNARVIDLEKNHRNSGVTPTNVGWRHARGTYVGALADDDVCYPDHVARLVDMLERNGGSVAHASTGFRFLERCASNDEGIVVSGVPYRTSGFNATLGTFYCDPHGMLVYSRVTLQAMLFRRELLAEIGGLSEEFWMLSDHEMCLRLSLRSDWLHSDRLTIEWRVRTDGGQFCENPPPNWQSGFLKMWEQHPYPDRPSLRQMREIKYARLMGYAEIPEEMRCKPSMLFPGGIGASA